MTLQPYDNISFYNRVVFSLICASFLLKLFLAHHYYGFLTGDDLEIAETAAKYALGVKYQPWELRCLFHPVALVAPLLALVDIFRPHLDSFQIVWIASLPTAVASTISVWLVYRLGVRLDMSPRIAALASALFTVHWLPLGYGATPYPRPLATLFFLWALLLVMRPARWRMFVAGCLLAAGFAVRFSEGVLLLPLLWFAWWRQKSLSALAIALAGFSVGVIMFVGVTDSLTWGQPFASLAAFVRIMYLNPPPSFPHYDKPWYWYASSVLQWVGPAGLALLLVSMTTSTARQACELGGSVVAAYSVFSYKTYRYLQSAIPLLALAMAVGCATLLGSRYKACRIAGGLLLLGGFAWGLERTISLLNDKSMDAVDAAVFIRDAKPRVVLLEQAWAYGGVLIVGSEVAILDLQPRSPVGLTPADLKGVDSSAFFTRDLSARDLAVLRDAGFSEARRFRRYRKAVTVFMRPY